MKSPRLLAALLIVFAFAAPAWAHFVWVAVQPGADAKPTAHVWFSELAEPDSAELIDKIVATKVWSRSADGKSQSVAVLKLVQDGGGALVGAVHAGTANLSAHIEYGVLTRGEKTFLLRYWAKYLDTSVSGWQTLARDEALRLDVVPHTAADGMTLEVLYAGQPASGSEVIILDPTGAETTAKADASGKLKLVALRPGLYSIRAKWVVEEAGKLAEQAYPQVNHYSTLALRVPPAK